MSPRSPLYSWTAAEAAPAPAEAAAPSDTLEFTVTSDEDEEEPETVPAIQRTQPQAAPEPSGF